MLINDIRKKFEIKYPELNLSTTEYLYEDIKTENAFKNFLAGYKTRNKEIEKFKLKIEDELIYFQKQGGKYYYDFDYGKSSEVDTIVTTLRQVQKWLKEI